MDSGSPFVWSFLHCILQLQQMMMWYVVCGECGTPGVMGGDVWEDTVRCYFLAFFHLMSVNFWWFSCCHSCHFYGVHTLFQQVTNERTPWSRGRPEKQTGRRLVKKCPHFMETRVSLPQSHTTPTCPCPEPGQFIPCSASHFLKIHANIMLLCIS